MFAEFEKPSVMNNIYCERQLSLTISSEQDYVDLFQGRLLINTCTCAADTSL